MSSLSTAFMTAGNMSLFYHRWVDFLSGGNPCHAYRRKLATERKQSNPKDVAAAGGWKDVSTLLEVYQQSDESSVLAVMSEPKKLRERGIA